MDVNLTNKDMEDTLISVESYGDIMEDYLQVSFHREVKALRKEIQI